MFCRYLFFPYFWLCNWCVPASWGTITSQAAPYSFFSRSPLSFRMKIKILLIISVHITWNTESAEWSIFKYFSPWLTWTRRHRVHVCQHTAPKKAPQYVWLLPVWRIFSLSQREAVQRFVFDHTFAKMGACFPTSCGRDDIVIMLNKGKNPK